MQMKRQDYTELESYCKQLIALLRPAHAGDHLDS